MANLGKMIFFNIHFIVSLYWDAEGQTINEHCYFKVVPQLRERITKKRPKLWKNKSWYFLMLSHGMPYSRIQHPSVSSSILVA